MATPREMFDHTLDAIKGWFHMAALDFTAPLSAEVTIDPVYAGRCVHLNDDLEFEMGCTGNQMPLFIFQSSDDPDVSRDFGGREGGAVSPSGNINAWVGKGAYELATTEFDSAQTYLPNQPLRAIADNDNATTGGRLTNQSVVTVASLLASGPTAGSVTAIVGHVSRGVYTNSHKKSVLAFWPGHYPGREGF